MSAGEFAEWSFVIIVSGTITLGILAAVVAGVVVSVGSVIEWFDKRKDRNRG